MDVGQWQNSSAAMCELDNLQLRANQITDESLESTRRMIALCEESKEAGIKTLVALDDQGEQLDHIEEGLDNINNEMKVAEKALKKMGRFCGLCTAPWRRSSGCAPPAVDDDAAWHVGEDGSAETAKNHRLWDKGACRQGRYITKMGGAEAAAEQEMEENMQSVGGMLANLRNMALDMNAEIRDQNEQMDRIAEKAASDQGQVARANQAAAEILKQ